MEIIYAIPGLGTTNQLYRNIKVPGYQLKVLEWPVPSANFNLQTYAYQFLDQIDMDMPVNLMGVSFGGMLSVEIAEKIPVNKVILISSCKNRMEFPFLLKTLNKIPFYKLLSDKTIRAIAITKRKAIGFEKSFEPVFIEMINQMPENYFPLCIDYIVNWQRTTNRKNIIRIHGTSDRLLTPPRAKDYYPVKNGTHAMILSDAKEINIILNRELNGL